MYAERMMLEAGWGDHEPELWLMHAKWNLRVVTNAILDYAVHVQGMTEAQAMDLLRREAFQEETEAVNKWRRVRLSQVQLTSYFTGYAEILDLRERRKAQLGEAFRLQDFHNRFLSYGNAPVAAIARADDAAGSGGGPAWRLAESKTGMAGDHWMDAPPIPWLNRARPMGPAGERVGADLGTP